MDCCPHVGRDGTRPGDALERWKMLDAKEMELILAVAEEGNLTRAAVRLHRTPSALSHRLRLLERRLGLPLFRRLGRRMTPTPAGTRLAEASRDAKAQIQAAVEEVTRTARSGHHVVRIATECYTCYHWLPSCLRTLRAELPDVEVKVVADATRQPLPALRDGDLDLAIVSRPARDRRLEEIPLFEDELVLVVPPGHALARRARVEPGDLEEEHLLVYDAPEDETTVLREFLVPAGIRPRRISRIQLTEGILELVEAGMGVAALASWAVAPRVSTGRLVRLCLGEKGLRRGWRAVITAHRETPDHVRALARHLPAAISLNPYKGSMPRREDR